MNQTEAPTCAACGRITRRNLKVPYCPDCRFWHCTDCGHELPPAHVRRRCGKCQYEASRRCFRKPGRRCALCRTPLVPGHPHTRCHACLCMEAAWYREFLIQRHDPHCEKCGVPIKGRPSRRCRSCDLLFLRSKGPRRCPRCRERPCASSRGYCRACDNMYHAWLKAYHRGDEGARALKTKRTYHYRKKES